jgi:hypothetical protein
VEGIGLELTTVDGVLPLAEGCSIVAAPDSNALQRIAALSSNTSHASLTPIDRCRASGLNPTVLRTHWRHQQNLAFSFPRIDQRNLFHAPPPSKRVPRFFQSIFAS